MTRLQWPLVWMPIGHEVLVNCTQLTTVVFSGVHQATSSGAIPLSATFAALARAAGSAMMAGGVYHVSPMLAMY